jgi:hypothetical protein
MFLNQRIHAYRYIVLGLLLVTVSCSQSTTTTSEVETAPAPAPSPTPAPAPEPAPRVAAAPQSIDLQPLAAQFRRLVEAGAMLGTPFDPAMVHEIDEAIASGVAGDAVAMIQAKLDPLCLAVINISPESRVKVQPGSAKPELMQQGWRSFLVRVNNHAGVTAELKVDSPQAAPQHLRSRGSPEPKQQITLGNFADRFLDVAMYNRQPLTKTLSGLVLEYRVVQLYSRDVGRREATLQFDVGQGTQDLGFRNEVSILFNVVPAVEVVLGVKDADGEPVMGKFIIRDPQGRIYPSPSRRIAPDFFFHPQIYRTDGESVMLPPGTYDVEYTRGPEYRIANRRIEVPTGTVSHKEDFKLTRWIDASEHAWFSGDHHVHAAGCSHYETPAEGVQPNDMMRHILGEDLTVGCVLTWGPCWYYQKQFFDGKVSKLSTDDYLMRYDVEVSGFPSSFAGHLSLIQLTEDDYEYPEPVEFEYNYRESEWKKFKGTKTDRIGQWPSWDQPVLEWGKRQGAVVGYSHSGWGLKVDSDELPNYITPPFDGIGANEYIVNVTTGVMDFISAVDTPAVWELNIWYHTLNCGFTCKISGETDFPCIYDSQVGLGRGYVKIDGALSYEKWVAGIKAGRSYVGDGRSHLIDFRVNDTAVGENGSELRLTGPSSVQVTARVAALLDEKPNEEIRKRPLDQKPYWNIERSRIGDSRTVPLEVIVNGYPVARKEIVADGELRDVSFDVPIERSSWIALRIFPSSHTNPIVAVVDDKPVRASRRSAEWCIQSVDKCWEQKHKGYRDQKRGPYAEKEYAAAKAAYDAARKMYEKILAECAVE